METSKEKENIEARFLKTPTPFEIVNTMNKTASSRQRVLKQLQQLGVDLTQYEDLPLQGLIAKTENLMRNTYSVKYLGLNKNQMGIISRRINPFTDKNFKIHQALGETYNVHKYFFPKPLKTGKKQYQVTQTINVNNLQNQIKKEFQQKEVEKFKNIRKHKDDKMKTKVAGSCFSLNKNVVSPQKTAINPNQLASYIMPKIFAPQSFSRFLKKGIMIVRD